MPQDLIPWLQLARSSGVGPARFFRLIERFGQADAALRWLASEDGRQRAGMVKLAKRTDIEREIEAVDAAGCLILAFDDVRYPAWLKEIAAPPPVITVCGRLDLFDQPMAAVVGARNASGNGCRFARQIAKEVSAAGVTIVSGLARGIDTAAHQGGLEGPGSTVAVTASGIDIAYPSENQALMAQIAEEGLVVTERPFGAPPTANHFPKRNRIIAGLSAATVVVEAAEKSGSLMTARLALESGRDVMAVPGSPMEPRHRGTNRLIKEGATMVESASDILENLPDHVREPMPRVARADIRPAPQRRKPLPVRPVQNTPLPSAKGSPDDLPEALEQLLGPEPLPVDELIRQCHASPAQIQDALLQLEMDGRISRHPGNRIAREVA